MAASEQRQSEFLALTRRIVGGEVITESEYLEHFEVQNCDASTGIERGEPAPTFRLPDQHGIVRDRDDLMGANGLLVVFARSAHFCGYCRNQLAELNLSLPSLQARGVNVVAITPDDVAPLASFSDAYGIAYPMLSDLDSAVIDGFGVLNPNLPVGARLHGAPFPGHFLVSTDGVVLEKAFTGDLRHRPSGSTLVFERFGPADGPTVKVASSELAAELAVSTYRVFGGQEVAVSVELEVAPGWHVYGEPLPANYQPLSITVDLGDLLSQQSFDFPQPEILRLAALGEDLPVYEGRFRVAGRLRVRWSPVAGVTNIKGVEHLDAGRLPAGEHLVTGEITYQACSDDSCLVPETLPFWFTLTVEDDVRSTMPIFTSEER